MLQQAYKQRGKDGDNDQFKTSGPEGNLEDDELAQLAVKTDHLAC